MFARVFAILPLALLAVATTDVCSSENAQCCNQAIYAYQAAEQGGSFLELLTAAHNVDLNAFLAMGCTAIGGSGCAAGSTCCTGDEFNNGFSLVNAQCNTVQL